MSSLRSRTSTTRFTTALGAGALALASIAASGGLSASAVAQPVAPAHPASLASAASTASAGGLLLLVGQGPGGAGAGPKRHPLGARREIAWQMMSKRFGWRPRNQFRFLNELWMRESSWNVYATNPYSGAYGIPQAVPGSKMASAGANWRTSARTQIRWGLRYIKGRYGSPSNAWAHENAYGWY